MATSTKTHTGLSSTSDEYKLEGLRRALLRKQKRKDKRYEKKERKRKLGGYCSCCGRGGYDNDDWY